jgi:hypothetical protein
MTELTTALAVLAIAAAGLLVFLPRDHDRAPAPAAAAPPVPHVAHARSAPAAPSPPARPAVVVSRVALEDSAVRTTRMTLPSGRLRFAVRNAGSVPHGFAVVPEGAHVDDGGHSHHGFIASGSELAPGERGSVAVTLEPGSYELICHLPGHYAAGQRVAVTVR